MEDIQDTRFSDALSERYLAYAMSTIMSRSLPDVRDGLKPVHRRLIYAMQQLRLDPASGFKKCARVVGDVMGKFHPHGDASIYDALVRLAQDFAVRYPLVEGQGNFGNIDGDNPAAMRYTEARMTAVAAALLAGIGEDTVDFRPTYDNEDQEPVVLPAAFPNLLANGAAGIAVGMATSIPPHNASEICAAAIHLIADPAATTAELLAHMPGPDFPTGGILAETPEALLAAYETGRGGFRLRARWAVEQGRFGTWAIVVTEIPYQVQKSRLIEQVAALMEEKKLPLLGDIRDESDEKIRLVLEPKSRGVEPEVLMETMFRATALETRFPLNMNVLTADHTPQVLGLRGVLGAWVAHREQVLARRSRHRLSAIERRLEILDGFIKVFLNLDEVIRIIREEDDAKAGLMRAFTLSEAQAEAILNMRLRSLRRLEEMEIKAEHRKLSREGRDLGALLASEKLRWARVSSEIEETRKTFGGGPMGARRTELGAVPAPVDITSIVAIEREPITVVLSEKGWIRALRGHVSDGDTQKFKEGDKLRLLLACQTTDKLVLLSGQGRAYTLRAGELPRGRGDGQALRVMFDMAAGDDIAHAFVWSDAHRYLLASSGGRGFLIPAEDLLGEKRTGKQVLVLRPGEIAKICVQADGDHLAVVGDNRKLLVFPLDQVAELSRGLGVTLQRYKDGGLADARVFRIAQGLALRRAHANGNEPARVARRARPGGQAAAERVSPVGEIRVTPCTTAAPRIPLRFMQATRS
jgi:topoisomerase-4 subunit A